MTFPQPWLPRLALMLLLASASTSLVTSASFGNVKGNTMELTELTELTASSITGDLGLEWLEEAISLAETIEDRKQQVDLFSELALRLSGKGEIERATELFDRAIALSQEETPDFYQAYYQEQELRDVIIQMAEAGSIDKALSTTDLLSTEMGKAEALNGITSQLIAQGKLDLARRTISRTLQAVYSISNYQYAYESNGSCRNYKFAVLANVAENMSLISQVDSALRIAERLRGCYSASGLPIEGYQAWAFLGILAQIDTVESLEMMAQQAVQIENDFEKIAVIPAIASQLIELKRPDLALSLAENIATEIEWIFPWETIANEGETAQFVNQKNALIQIANQLGEAGDIEAARQISQWGDNPLVQSEIMALTEVAIAGYWKSQDRPEMVTSTLDNIQLPQVPESIEPNGYWNLEQAVKNAHTEIAIQMAKIGETNRALALASQFDEAWSESRVLLEIIEQLIEQEKIDIAIQLIPQISYSPNQVTAIEKISAQIDEQPQLQSLVKVAQSLDNALWKHKALFGLAAKMVEFGETETGLQLMVGADDPQDWISFAKTLAQFGEIEQARKSLENIENPLEKARGLGEIALMIGDESIE